MIESIPSELSGVFAALPTPFGADGNPTWEAMDALVDFALASGLEGLCLGGATSEYAACSVEQRVEMFARVAERVKGRAHLICAIGAEHAGQVRRLARAAADCGAIAVLFPPPAFLPHPQGDLLDFMTQVSADLPLPVLLYHIPQCTRDLGIENVLRLIAEAPNIIGLKDSSGQKGNLAVIGQAKTQTPLVFFIGSDDLFLEAFEHGAVGVISGIAGACPELLLPLYEALRAGNKEQASALQARLNDLILHLDGVLAPWAVKLALQARGVDMGSMAWPMGPHLSQKVQEFKDWFSSYLTRK
jgi:dihydrodipicolinate synthase/N-acetylneuraminate lyase